MALISALLVTLIWLILIVRLRKMSQSPERLIQRKFRRMIEKEEALRAESEEKENTQPSELAFQKPFESMSFTERVLHPFISWVSETLQHFVPTELGVWLERRLQLANLQDNWTVRRFTTLGILTWLLGTVTSFYLILHFGNLKLSQQIVLLLMGGLCGTALPFLVLNNTISIRKETILRQMPEIMDLLCISVQAGLSFDAAVSKITKRMNGPLIDEFRHVQLDTAMGMTRQHALEQMARRCDLEALYLFTSSVIQAEQLGANMARTLQMQADNMRDRHRQYIKSQAMKTPVKITFPMIIFIFPAMLIIVLYPTIFMLYKTMGR